MKYLEQHLPSQMFVRIHRSFIVNVKAISRIESYGKNRQTLILRTGVQLNMSVVGHLALKMLLHL
ncbi:MAG: LytTR family transcriptional regulator DNA-binding domain-containing protein [Microbacter sp.]